MEITPIARIRTDLPDKFGLPRQSGLVPQLTGEIVFEPSFRDPNAIRGLEGFSRIWLIWGFSRSRPSEGTRTVRPPRLGGNERMGVFATRSPFRPNGLGLSCVCLERITLGTEGPVLTVSGIDLMDGTPIYDIKPYLPYADSYPDASGGFGERVFAHRLNVLLPDEAARVLPPDKLAALTGLLENDPRPGYQDDPERVYGMRFAGYEVKFRVEKDTLYVLEIGQNR